MSANALTSGLSDTDLAAVLAVQRLASEVVAPLAKDTDAHAAFPWTQIRALAEIGVLGMNLPVRWGGPGISAPAFAACVEAIAGACGSTASAITAHFLATDAILIGGDDDLRTRYLPLAATGGRLGAFALTEPRAGSNPADMRCRATPNGGDYALQGVKHFISNGGVADFIVVFAVTDPDAGHRGISAFVVDRATPVWSPAAPSAPWVSRADIFSSWRSIAAWRRVSGSSPRGAGSAPPCRYSTTAASR